MKRKSFIFFILIAIGSFCFAQGHITPCNLIYPEDFCKDFFILQKKSISISKGSKSDFRSEVNLDVVNVKESAESTFGYINFYGPSSRKLKENCISVYINDKSVKAVKGIYQDGEKYLFESIVPSGHFKIKYIIEHNGYEISGQRYCEISNYCIKNWNVSDSYSEEISISLYNDIISFDREDAKIVGKGKQNGNSYFLKSGGIYYSTKKRDSDYSIICQIFFNGFGGGSGAPTLPSIYNDDKKISSATDFIYQFITAAKIISKELEYDYLHDRYEDLIEYIKLSSKEELRLFRNAFYAKNGYVFKDSALNDFFNTSICYWPDNSVTLNSIKMTEEERILLEMIQDAEKGEQPEDILNKYKK